MEAVMAVMIVIMLVAALGSGGFMMGRHHGDVAQTQDSAKPADGKKDCQPCPPAEKTEKGNETPAN